MRRMVPVLTAALVVALALAACGDDDADPTTTTTTTVATTTTTLDPEAALEAEVLAEIDPLVEAWNAADVDGFLGFVQTSLSDAERLRQGFFSAWSFAPISGCEIDSLSDFLTSVVCEAESADPVYLEFGPAELSVVFSRYGDGYNVNFGAAGGGGGGSPRQYADTVAAYGEYLSQYDPDAYAAVCDPEGYEMEIRFEYGVSLTPECGALLPTAADEAAEWLRNGRPES
jgi:hypothetical protein